MRFSPSIRSCLLFLLLFCTVLGTGYAVLQSGLRVDRLTLAGVTVEDSTLIWDNGLNLEIVRVQLDDKEGKSTKKLNGATLQKTIKTVRFLRKIVPSITVHSLHYKKYSIEIQSQEGQSPQPLVFTLNADDLHLKAMLAMEQNDIRISLTELASTKFNSSARGSFLVNTNTFQGGGEIETHLAGCLPVQFSILADVEGISFQGQESAEITTIKPFIDLFGLSEDIQPWITDYLKGSRYHLKSVSGYIPWHDPAAILDTLTASVRIDDCAYVFAQGFEPMKSEYADVHYGKGILNIIPHNSSFHGQDGEKSWLNINFNDPDNILLTVFIKTRARANVDIVRLLDYYNLDLPFVQTTGKIDTDLTLAINLNREQVQASGAFGLGESLFTHEGQSYHVQDGRIELQDEDITIERLNLSLKDLFRFHITGGINVKESGTDLNIEVVKALLPLKDIVLALDSAEAPLQLDYSLRAGNGTLTAKASQWTFGSKKLRLDAFSMPFDIRQFSGNMPPTRLVSPSRSELLLGGQFNVEKQLADMQVTLKHLQTPFLALAQESLLLNFHFDGQLHVTTNESSRWQFAGRDMTFFPLDLRYGKDRLLRVEKGQIQIPGFFDTLIKGEYDFSSGRGTFLLDELVFTKKDSAPFLEFPRGLILDMGVDDGSTWVSLDQLGLFLLSEEQGGWEVVIRDLGKLLDHSKLLQRLKITGGSLHLETVNSSSPLQFSGKVSSAYDFLVQDDQPQSEFDFSGTYSETGLDLVVNKDFHLHYSDTIEISSRNLGYNVPAIYRFRKDRPEQEMQGEKKEDTPEVLVQAEDSFLFFRKGNRILADTMTFTVRDNKRDLVISHGQGDLIINLLGDSMSLKGQNLNDQFINALVAEANVKGGYLRAVAEGTLDKFSAIFHTDEILLKEYAMLNNILAVTNTLPALITFSLPQYDRGGWPVDSSLFWFDYDQGIATVKSLQLNSSEMDIRGSGTMDLLKQQVDLKVNMLTQAGQNISKIPLLGYILAGEEERPTLTFHVTGDLLDPTVESTTFEEILTMPFEMIYRTLVSPFKLAEDVLEHGQGDSPLPVENRSYSEQ